MGAQVLDRLRDRTVPCEAQVAVARLDGDARERLGRQPGAMTVQLDVAEAVGRAPAGQLFDLGTEHVAIEGVGSIPVRHLDHCVIEADREDH